MELRCQWKRPNHRQTPHHESHKVSKTSLQDNLLLYRIPFYLESFLLYPLFARAARRQVLDLLYPLSLRKLFIIPVFCARSAKKNFYLLLRMLIVILFWPRAARRKFLTLLYPFSLGKLFIISHFYARSAKKIFNFIVSLFSWKAFYYTPFLRAQHEEKKLLYYIPCYLESFLL